MTDTITLDGWRLIRGVGDVEARTACLMSARALLDGRGLTDEHPSAVIRAFGIGVNDRFPWTSDAERTATLLPAALDERLSYVVVTRALEQARAYRCADMACRVWAPRALDAADYHEEAGRLRALAPIVDVPTALEARCRAAYAYAAAYAAAYADTVDAAVRAARAARAAARAARAAVHAAVHAARADRLTTRAEAIALLFELCEMGR